MADRDSSLISNISRESGLDLFDAFASKEQMLHAFPGGHHEVPAYVRDSSGGLFARHLGTSPALR